MPPASLVCPACWAELPSGGTSCPACGTVMLPADGSSVGPTLTADSSPSAPDPKPAGPAPPHAFLAPPEAPDEIGRLGPYRVLAPLGAGGMGLVFRAEDPGLRRQVALKVMLPDQAAAPTARARFLREARAAAAVEHDHIVPIFQVGEDRDVPFLAMPLLKGEPLSAYLKDAGGPLALFDAVRIAREAADGLAAAHGQGLIHRDIKPANIWLEGPRRRVRILDFGLARPAAEAGPEDITLTGEGSVVGTPAYMSPEQARGEALDARTDLWSLGVVLYQMLTGRLPFQARTSSAVLMAIAAETPPPPSALNPAVPPALDGLVGSLLQKQPADRPATAAEVAGRLADLEVGLTAVPLADAAEAAPADLFSDLDATETDVAPVRVPPARRRGPVLVWGGLGLAVLLAIAAGGWQAFGRPARGVLVVECDDPDAAVTVRRDGEVVADGTRDRELRLPAGEYAVESPGGRVSPDRVTVGRGGRVVVRVDRVTSPPPVRKDRPPAAVVGDPLVTDYREAHGLDLAGLKAWAAGLPAGFRPTWVSPRPADKGPAFDAVAVAGGPAAEWKLLTPEWGSHDLVWKVMSSTGFRLALNGLYTTAGAPGELYLWVKDGASWGSFIGSPGTIEDRLREAKANGYRPVHLSGARFPEGLTIDLATRRMDGDWEAKLDLSPADLARDIDLSRRRGWRPELVAAYDNREPARFLAVFAPNPGGVTWEFDPGLTEAEYEQALAARKASRFRPRTVAAYRAADKAVRSAVVWEAYTPVPADPDRRAAEAVRRFVTALTVRPRTGPDQRLLIDQPLPDQPFTLVGFDAAGKPLPRDFGRTLLPAFAPLTGLEAFGNRTTVIPLAPEEVDQLTGMPFWSAVTTLGLDVPLAPRVVDALKGFPKLADLTLNAARADDAAVARLRELPRLTHLGLMNLGKGGPGLTPAGWAALGELPLRSLRLNQAAAFGKPAGEAVAGLKDLESLVLYHAAVDEAGLRALARCPKLTHLTLPYSSVTDAALEPLAGLTTLRSLNLAYTEIGDAGLAHLAGATGLRELDVRSTRVTEAGVKKLAAALPQCKIEWAAGPDGPKP